MNFSPLEGSVFLKQYDMFEKILRNSNPIKENGFEYYTIQEDYEVSINCIQQRTKVPPHAHDQEVFNYVFNGEFSILMDNIEKSYLKGEWVHIPAGRIHSVETKTNVILLELWKK